MILILHIMIIILSFTHTHTHIYIYTYTHMCERFVLKYSFFRMDEEKDVFPSV